MKILRADQVAEKFGMGKATVWRKAKEEPDFPKPVKVSAKITGWVESEVDRYIAAKVSEARGERAPA